MATSAQVQQLYLTYFGRPADPEGLRFWTSDPATPIATIANSFANAQEFTNSIAGKSFAQVVNQFYVSLFNRNAETAGLNYWVGLLQQGLITLQQVGLNISNTALAQPTTSGDFISVSSKLTAAANFTTEVGLTTPGILAYSGPAGVAAGVQFLTPVSTTATIPSAAATTAAVNNLITSNSGVGTTVELSAFQDIFTPTSAVRLSIPGGTLVETLAFRFTADSQSVGAPPGSIQGPPGTPALNTDQLIDPAVTDSDNLNITVAPGFGNIPDLRTINIENFKFFLNGADRDGVFAFTANQTNVKSVVLSGTLNENNLVPFNGYSINNFGDSGATVFDASAMTTPGDAGRIFANAYAAPAAGNAAVTMTGGAGNDRLEAGFGNDVLNGGAGNDFLVAFDGNDTMNGGSGADNMFGDLGNDSMSGGLDADNIFGQAGNDTLLGNEGNDTLRGGAGNDSITGGTGVDTMAGELGNNRFIYGSFATLVADTGNTDVTSDIITDFDPGAPAAIVDALVTGVAGTATNFKVLPFAFGTYDLAKTGAQSPGGFDGAVRYVYAEFFDATVAANRGVLFVDTDANNTSDASILFNGTPALAFQNIIA